MALLGKDAKIYYKVGGVSGGGSWTELTNTRDVTLNMSAEEADITTRANAGWKARVVSEKDLSADFEMLWDEEDDGFGAIQDAFLDGTIIGLRVLTSASGQGPESDFMIFDFTRTEGLRDAIVVKVTAKNAGTPDWIGG